MIDFFGIVESTITFWSLLFLISLGFTLILGLMKKLNLAHGALVSLSGFLSSLYFSTLIGYILGVFTAITAGALFGVLLFFLFRRIRSDTEAIILTYGLMLLMEGIFQIFFGKKFYNNLYISYQLGEINILNRHIPLAIVVVDLISLVLLFSIVLFLRTKTGTMLRATIDDPEFSKAVGINSEKLIAISLVFGASAAALGGALSSLWQSFTLGLSGYFLVYAFAILVIGGMGNVIGSAIAALIIAFIRSLLVFIFPELELVLIYLIVILVLLIRPGGLFRSYVRVA